MVAYSFKTGFVAPIRLRTKQQTIRNPRKRHSRAGEAVQLYFGMRTRSCFLIGVGLVAGVHDVRLDFAENLVELDSAIVHSTPEALDAFARRDGFEPPASAHALITPWRYMARWWGITHPGAGVFRGVLIDWGDSFQTPEALAAWLLVA